LIVDDNLLTRTGIRGLVSSHADLQVVGEAADGANGLALARQLRPDVTIMDLRMPGLDGVKTIELMRGETPEARILVLTHYDGDENVFRAMRAGARGYLLKETTGDELARAIRTIAADTIYLPPHIGHQLARRTAAKPLSARELQILKEVATGASNRDIAATLSLTEKTVTVYVSHVIAKLGARSRTEAVAIGLRRGLIPLP
jgi:DNA-binding NarL/FixJ family response regulator